MNEELMACVQKITKLPTVPVIAQQVLNLTSDEMASVVKLEKIIENDPAIAARILSVSNSAFFDTGSRTSSLHHAILRVGFNNVRYIALGISLMTIFGNGRQSSPFDYQRVFNHSVTVGFVARLMAKHLGLNIAEDALMNGLLHDIGFLILNRYFPDRYQDVMRSFRDGTALLDAEQKVLGFSHAEIGSWLAQEWRLPGSVADTILFHHAPTHARKHLNHVAIVHIADYITSKGVLSPMKEDPMYPIESLALEILGLSHENFKLIEAEVSNITFSGEIFP